MRPPSNRMLQQVQRNVAEGFYVDQAVLLINVPTGSYDSYNQPVVEVSEVPIKCSFTDSLNASSREAWRSSGDIENVEAEIRFTGPEPLKGYKVRVTSRYDSGIPYTREYEIEGIQNRDLFGWVCALKSVTL